LARKQEERRRRLQAAVDAIPTQRDALFAVPIHWDLLSKVRPAAWCISHHEAGLPDR